MNAWVCQEFQHHRYGLLVVNVYTFFEQVTGDSNYDHAAMLNLLDKQMKLKLSTGSEALTLCSLRYSIPPFFTITQRRVSEGAMDGLSYQSFPAMTLGLIPNLG